MNKTSPIYNYSNFVGHPSKAVCRKCGGNCFIGRLKANGKWFTVQPHGNDFVWHVCNSGKAAA